VNQTDVAQPAIYVTSVACWRGLLERGVLDESSLAATAGLSLGEYTALHLAGVFSFEDGLKLVTERGDLMQKAAEASEGGMVALTRATEEQAETICNEARENGVLVCANFNAPGQIVLSGAREACERALVVAEKLGLRATPLAVAGAFHSPLMQPAADRMGEILETVEFHAPRVPVVSNVTALPHNPEKPALIRKILVDQIVSSVKWNQSCDWLVNNMIGMKMHELAPGRVLSGLMRRIHKESEVINHDAPSGEDEA
jgi:[acyl-carrier-protein] S-malonyltransferase